MPVLLRLSPRIDAMAQPFITAVMSIPKLGLVPLLVLWFGTGWMPHWSCSVSLRVVSSATIFPRWMMSTCSQMAFTSARMCVESTTVCCPLSDLMSSSTSRRCL